MSPTRVISPGHREGSNTNGQGPPSGSPLGQEQPEKPPVAHPPAPSPSSLPGGRGTQPPRLSPGTTAKPRANVTHRFLSPSEWARMAHGVGAVKDSESLAVVHPKCWYWPPKGLPDGLYRDVVFHKTKFYLAYRLLSAVRWILMIMQIVLGAVLTALGSMSPIEPTAITVLAAVNTLDAGLLALMHNSGLPERYQSNKDQFSKVEDHLRELIDTGIVESEKTVDEVLAHAYSRFHAAKATVVANIPSNYTRSSTPTHSMRSKSSIPSPRLGTDSSSHTSN